MQYWHLGDGGIVEAKPSKGKNIFSLSQFMEKVGNEMVVLALIPMSDYVAAKPKSLGLLSYFIIEA